MNMSKVQCLTCLFSNFVSISRYLCDVYYLLLSISRKPTCYSWHIMPLLPQIPQVPRWSQKKRLWGHIQGPRYLPLPLMEGEDRLGVQVCPWGPSGRRKRSRRRRGAGRGGRVGQLDWGWGVQGEVGLRAERPSEGLRPPGGSGRQCRFLGHQVVMGQWAAEAKTKRKGKTH